MDNFVSNCVPDIYKDGRTDWITPYPGISDKCLNGRTGKGLRHILSNLGSVWTVGQGGLLSILVYLISVWMVGRVGLRHILLNLVSVWTLGQGGLLRVQVCLVSE